MSFLCRMSEKVRTKAISVLRTSDSGLEFNLLISQPERKPAVSAWHFGSSVWGLGRLVWNSAFGFGVGLRFGAKGLGFRA